MLKKIFCFFVVVIVLLAGFAIAQETKPFTADRHKARGLKCEACHKEAQPKTPATAAACLTCHKSLANIEKRTENFNVNPHKNHITESSEVECTQCHQAHKEDILLCNNCHQGLHVERDASAAENK